MGSYFLDLKKFEYIFVLQKMSPEYRSLLENYAVDKEKDKLSLLWVQ